MFLKTSNSPPCSYNIKIARRRKQAYFLMKKYLKAEKRRDEAESDEVMTHLRPLIKYLGLEEIGNITAQAEEVVDRGAKRAAKF